MKRPSFIIAGMIAPAPRRRNGAARAPARYTNPMRRPLDRYDYIGLLILALLVALWIAHFVLPPGPPPVDLAR